MSFEKRYKQFQRDWKKGKYKGGIRTVGLCVLTACVVLLGTYYFQGRRAESNIDQLRQQRQAAMATPNQWDSSPETETEDTLSQYARLHDENPDLVGWLTIDGTKVDYPVMFTPDNPEYYSRRGFDKKESMNGLLFMDENSNFYDYGGNVVIYGHNMKNGSMFADLLKYRDENFWAKHSTIKLDTLHESRVYEIAAVLESGDMSELPFAFMRSNDKGAEEVLQRVREDSLYDTGVPIKYGNDFLTLSTCDYDTADGRFVVVARRIQ